MNMNATPYPIWTETGLDFYDVQVAITAYYGVSDDGKNYYVNLPGQGLRKCWNRKQVERICLDHYEQMLAQASRARNAPDDINIAEDRLAEAGERQYKQRREGVL